MQRAVAAWRAALLFGVLTVLLTWPQVRHPLSVPDHFDPYFSMWRIAWIAHQLPHDPARLFDANIFYPLRHALAYSDAALLESLVAAPFVWIGVPLVNGYSGFWPATYIEMVRAMRDFPSDQPLAILRERGVRYVILHGQFYGEDRYRAVARALDARDDVEAQGAFAEGTYEARAYRLLPRSGGPSATGM